MEKPDKPSKETLEKWSKDPNNWIWGMFYYNKEDKRLLPPKQNPVMGWTVNFANTNSVLSFIITVATILLFVTVIQRNH